MRRSIHFIGIYNCIDYWRLRSIGMNNFLLRHQRYIKHSCTLNNRFFRWHSSWYHKFKAYNWKILMTSNSGIIKRLSQIRRNQFEWIFDKKVSFYTFFKSKYKMGLGKDSECSVLCVCVSVVQERYRWLDEYLK